jgi:hypothetical protein
VRLDPANATKLYALVAQEGVLNTTVVITGSASAAVARRPADAGVERTPEPAFASPSYRSYDRSYGYSSSDERYAPLQIYRERDDGGSGYPPAPPPNYPPYPRAWR